MTSLTYTTRVLPAFTLSLFIASIGSFISLHWSGFFSKILLQIVIVVIFFFITHACQHIKKKHEAGAMLLYVWMFIAGMILTVFIYDIFPSFGDIFVLEGLFLTFVMYVILTSRLYGKDRFSLQAKSFLILAGIDIMIGLIFYLFFSSPLLLVIGDAVIFSIISILFYGKIEHLMRAGEDDDIYSEILGMYLDFPSFLSHIRQMFAFMERRA